MGDISELRGLVTVVTFLGVIVVLFGIIPPQFYTVTEGRLVSVPEIYETIDIYSFAEYKTICMNETGGEYLWGDSSYYLISIDIGNWDINFVYKRANETELKCQLLHIHYEWIIFPADHYLEWFNYKSISREKSLSNTEIEADTQDGKTATYRAVCSHTTYHTTFAFNSTQYSSFTEAWNHHGLWVFFGVNFDDTNTSYNAFQLISMLLFFQLPEVHWIINAILAIPLWACVAYLSFILILRAVGAIFGGGA